MTLPGRSMVVSAVFGLAVHGTALAASPDCSAPGARGDQYCEALALKEKYLKGTRFVADPPSRTEGTARSVRSTLSSTFSSGGTSRIGGSVAIERLRGRFRLTLARTTNTLYYGRKVRVSGTISIKAGRLEIYSPVDIDFWKMAALFVDRPDRRPPAPEDLVLKGYVVTEIAPGAAQDFSAELLSLGGDFMLLLYAPDGEAWDIRIDLSDK